MNRFVAWGGATGLESHRWIHRAYYETAVKMGVESRWVDDDERNRALLQPGTTVLAANIYGNNIGEAVEGVNYVIHNFDASHVLCQTANPDRLLRLQVYTDDSFGEPWDHFRLYLPEAHLLFQPWGTNLLAEEFYDPVFNALSRTVAFVGAIWSDQFQGKELGNLEAIKDLRRVCSESRLQFLHKTQVSDQEMVEVVRSSRLAPAYAGEWQVGKNYLPCRLFKNVSYGALGVTNVPKLANHLGVPLGSIEETMDWALGLRRKEYLDLVKEQQRFVAKYTYRDSFAAIEEAFHRRGV